MTIELTKSMQLRKGLGSILFNRTTAKLAFIAFATVQIYDDGTYTRGVIREARRQAAYWVVNQTALLDDAYEYDHAQPIKTAKKR